MGMIENMDLEIKPRTVHATRITQELLTYTPTQVKVGWDEDTNQWVHEDTLDEVETNRMVMKAEELYEGGEEHRAAEHFDEAVLRFNNHKTIRLKELKELAKAIAYGFSQAPDIFGEDSRDAGTTTALRNVVSEIAHSMNRKDLVSNDDVGVFVADLYTELKI